jgi:hypothetical protein
MTRSDQPSTSFLRELRRRKVIRTCVVYIVLCWGGLQVGDIVVPAMGYEGNTASLYFIYLAILGFPITFAIAWFFQVTPQGIVRTDNFVERRVLSNIPPINDQRHSGVTTYFRKGEERPEHSWILSAETGPLSGLSFGISGPTVLGRALDCDIAMVSPHVSREHARLELDEEQQLYVEDLESSNGTVVNGKPVQSRQALHHEDELRFHDIVFRVTESYSGTRRGKNAMNQTTFIEASNTVEPPEP